MRDRQKYLLLRYSDVERNCIDLHQEIIQQVGYCWFGKIGSVPSSKMLSEVFFEQSPVLVLYRKNASYICELEKYTLQTPNKGIPEYYNSKGINPSIYFCLRSITQCDNSLFHTSIVMSTGAYVEDVIYRSRIPFMLCQYIDESKMPPLAEDDCRYQKDGFCTCRSCVNYDCLCERPKQCTKQRR